MALTTCTIKLSKQASPIHRVPKLQQIFLMTKETDMLTSHNLKLSLD